MESSLGWEQIDEENGGRYRKADRYNDETESEEWLAWIHKGEDSRIILFLLEKEGDFLLLLNVPHGYMSTLKLIWVIKLKKILIVFKACII